MLYGGDVASLEAKGMAQLLLQVRWAYLAAGDETPREFRCVFRVL
jgi:hypothetical protein